jgi:hypothetical protein
MSDEQRNEEETEVEGHINRGSANEEPREEIEDEVEGHIHRGS